MDDAPLSQFVVVVIYAAIGLTVIFFFRAVWLWFFRVNDIVSLLQECKEQNREILELLRGKGESPFPPLYDGPRSRDEDEQSRSHSGHKEPPGSHSDQKEQAGTYSGPKYFEAWEGSLTTLWQGRGRIEFAYVNRKGERTRREVMLEAVKADPEGDIYLYGFCMFRQERRNFKAVRIDDTVTNVYTGEVMEIVDYLISLGIDAPTAAAGVEW